jgi:hypothetical protein
VWNPWLARARVLVVSTPVRPGLRGGQHAAGCDDEDGEQVAALAAGQNDHPGDGPIGRARSRRSRQAGRARRVRGRARRRSLRSHPARWPGGRPADLAPVTSCTYGDRACKFVPPQHRQIHAEHRPEGASFSPRTLPAASAAVGLPNALSCPYVGPAMHPPAELGSERDRTYSTWGASWDEFTPRSSHENGQSVLDKQLRSVIAAGR